MCFCLLSLLLASICFHMFLYMKFLYSFVTLSCNRLDIFNHSLLVVSQGFDVAKTGDARIGFVGFPSVGKSTLLSNLAGVYSEVAAYEFTTLTTVPGELFCHNCKYINLAYSC